MSAFLTGFSAMVCGLLMLLAACFGTVSSPWLPDLAAHILLGVFGVGAIVHGATR